MADKRVSDFNANVIDEFRANERPGYAEYEANTERQIPVVALQRRS